MKPVDIAERRKIVEELGRTFLVEAGAGSGKTKSLVDRMIAYLRGGSCRIDTLAAVTFTKKAAAELRERFQTNLEKAYAEAGKEKEKQRLGESLRNLEQCFVGTIHSFCGRMLRERPIEIALMPDFREMDDIEDAVYREQCWLDYLVEVRRDSPPELEELEAVGLEPEDLKDAFTVISLYPEVTLIGGKDLPPEFRDVKKRLLEFLGRMRDVVPFKKQDENRDDFQIRMGRLFVRQKNIGFDNFLDLMDTMEDMDKGFGITQKHWPDKEVARRAKADFDLFREDVVREVLAEWREFRHSRIISFLKPAVRFFYEQRKKHSLVNFADLILSVSTLLRNNPQVRGYFQKKFTHILVDEFQDTDPVQAEILMYLTGADVEEKDWQKVEPRPGSLFLVGDPKQSIYRFRRADIDTYNVVKEQILRGGGDVLKLTANFRSVDSLAEWNDRIFEGTFPEESSRHQAPFAAMNTVRKDEEGAWSGVYKITNEKRFRNSQKLIAEEDAAAIADWIRWACDGNVRLLRTEEERDQGLGDEAVPADFLLLFRRKKRMNIYARSLEERGIPYEITGSDAFSESDDICEIVNLARALKDPDNPIFTVSVLRGIFFGVSDNALLEFKREGGRFSYLRGHDLGESQGAKYVAECMGVLKKWWRWTKDFPASAAMEMIFEDSGIISYLASSDTGSSKAGNVLKLLEFLRSRERDGKTSFAEIVEYMEELSDVQEVQEMSLTPGRVDAVRLMNLHKAKGLEASVVFLANPALGKYFPPDKHVVRLEEGGPRGYFLFKKKKWFTEEILSQPMGWAKSAVEETLYETAEEDRLMYVASTRAKNLLVVSTYEGNLSRKSWELLDDYLVDVPELEIPEPSAVVGKEEVTVSERQYEGVRESLRANIERRLEPSYLVENVTSLAKGEGERPGWSDSGKGMRWGHVVHHVLNVVGREAEVSGGRGDGEEGGGRGGFDLNLLARNALIAEEMDVFEKMRLVGLIESIMKSELWKRILASEKKYFEVPFSVKTDTEALPQVRQIEELGGHDARRAGEEVVVDREGDGKEDKGDGKGKGRKRGGSKGQNAGILPIILSGAIDLVFWEGDGWVIADYKTDEVDSGPKLQSFIDYYTPQVKIYSRFWEQITGQKVKESGLYFTNINKWVEVSP